VRATSPTPLIQRACAAAKKSKLIAASNAFDVLDVHVKYDVSAAIFNLKVYDNLLAIKVSCLNSRPGWQHHMRATDEGRRWIFHLQRGARFHDPSEVTAEAVRFSFERLLALGVGSGGKAGKTSPRESIAARVHTVLCHQHAQSMRAMHRYQCPVLGRTNRSGCDDPAERHSQSRHRAPRREIALAQPRRHHQDAETTPGVWIH